ncbi:MAG TPA: hypothetical protein VGB50_05850 [Flavobacterium sp.]|jgi:hypothetical protein
MALNKFEKDVREKLNSREIDPSAGAWDRLDVMLTVAEEKQPKRSFTWLYIAAAVLGVLLMGTLFFNQQENIKENDNAVATEDHAPVKEQRTQREGTTPLDHIKAGEAVASEPVTEEKIPTSVKQGKPQVLQQVTQNMQLASNEPSVQQKSSIINHNQVDSPAVNVDELLAAVDKPTRNEEAKPSVKIDPNSLLSQVDGELELTFREKVIKNVKKNYKTVKVALATRNDE